MTPTTSKTTEKQNILPMEHYNLAQCSIYNEQPAEKKYHEDKHNDKTTIPLIGAL